MCTYEGKPVQEEKGDVKADELKPPKHESALEEKGEVKPDPRELQKEKGSRSVLQSKASKIKKDESQSLDSNVPSYMHGQVWRKSHKAPRNISKLGRGASKSKSKK